jgi:hypothetical protein
VTKLFDYFQKKCENVLPLCASRAHAPFKLNNRQNYQKDRQQANKLILKMHAVKLQHNRNLVAESPDHNFFHFVCFSVFLFSFFSSPRGQLQ